MNPRTESKNLFSRSVKIAPGGVHSPVRAFKSVGGEPIFFSKAEGAYLESVDGEKFIDFCMSFGPNILGHRDPVVQEHVQRMVGTAWSLGACEPYSVELAEKILSKAKHVEKVRFVCSGTEAVMTAIRIARAATNRPKILKFEGCYHGHVDSMLVKSGSGLAGEASSDSAGVMETMAKDTLVAPLDNEKACLELIAKHSKEIAGVILEPLPANFGLLKQRPEFWTTVLDAVRKAGGLIIFDEVISGFRVSWGGMAELMKYDPDLVTYGKVIGGGFPVGAYSGKSKYMDLIAPSGPVYQAGTLAANPIGMVAGLETMKRMEQENIFETLEKRTTRFVSGFQKLLDQYKLGMKIISQGSIFWGYRDPGKPIRSIKDFATDQGESYKKFFHAILNEGVYFAPSGYEVGFVSLAHTDALLDETLNRIESGLKKNYK